MTENKIKITHGIYRYKILIHSHVRLEHVSCRNTEKHLPLPLEFRELLRTKYLIWWHVKTSVYRFGRRIPIDVYMDEPIEFTIAHHPDSHTTVIAIVHPKDRFKRKTAVKIVKERMEHALKYPNNDKSWSYKLK